MPAGIILKLPAGKIFYNKTIAKGTNSQKWLPKAPPASLSSLHTEYYKASPHRCSKRETCNDITKRLIKHYKATALKK